MSTSKPIVIRQQGATPCSSVRRGAQRCGRRCATVLLWCACMVAPLCVAVAAAAQTSAAASTADDSFPRTESSAVYPLPGSNGGTLTVHAGMPAQLVDYGEPPAFETLDTNHDGRISEDEAAAYPPLDSDFLYASGGAKVITKAQYEKWVKQARSD